LVEQAVYFAIGFLTAALVATAMAPLLSRRAMRLAVARARLRAPVGERQAIAAADALRAEHAVEQVRTERKLARAEERRLGLEVAVGRQSSEIIRLRNDVADLSGELHDRRAELETLASHARDLEATAGASEIALHDAFAQRDRAAAAGDGAVARAAELEAEVMRDRARIAVVMARAEYLEGRVEDLMREENLAREKGRRAAASQEADSSRMAALEDRLRIAAAENRNLADQLSRAATQRRDLAVEVAELNERLRLSERGREETLLENGRRLADLADRDAALAAATANAASLEARFATLAAESHARESPASRDRRAAAAGESRAVDAELRDAIARLGRDVVALIDARTPRDEQPVSPVHPEPVGAREPEYATAEGEATNFRVGPRRRAGRSRAPER